MDPIVVSRREVLALADAHQKLDGVESTPFKFGAKVRYTLAKNLRILQNHADDIRKGQTGVIREKAPPGTKVEPGSAVYAEIEKELSEFLDEKLELSGVLRISLADLALDMNPIPITVLCSLGPVVRDDVA